MIRSVHTLIALSSDSYTLTNSIDAYTYGNISFTTSYKKGAKLLTFWMPKNEIYDNMFV